MDLGNLKLDDGAFLAPLCGVTTKAFRKLCRRYGAAVVYSETVSADGINMMNARTLDLARFDPEERPIGIQIFGCDAERIALAARIIEDLVSPDLIDLNFGCPVPKFVKKDKGAALLRDPARIRAIVQKTVKNVTIPVTCKMRTGWDEGTIVVEEIARIVEGEGGSALTIHGRTRSQGYSGTANWDWIRKAVDLVSIPIIGNGDVTGPSAAERRMKETGCRAVMIGRGAIGNPWVFRDVAARMAGEKNPAPPTPAERLAVVLEHIGLQIDERGERRGIPEFRRHLSAYTKGLPGSAAFRNRVNKIDRRTHLEELLEEFFSAQEREGRPHAA